MAKRWPGNAKRLKTTFGTLSRSSLMSRIRSSENKTTELRMLALLKSGHVTGWRRHAELYGKPDFVWHKQKVALFVDGCFWHGHFCQRNLTPRRNADVWALKILKNKSRDHRVNRELRKLGWVVIRVWECRLARSPEPYLNKIRCSLGDPTNMRISLRK